MSTNNNYDDTEEIVLTPEGKAKYEEQLKNLREVHWPEIIKQLQEARMQGDLSENADYDSAKDAQAKVDGEIKQIEQILNNAKIISADNGNAVSVGKIVEFKREDTKKTRTIQIVGQYEADPDAEPYSKIASDSPLGKALIGQKVGAKVQVKTNQSYSLEITKITR